MTFLNQEIRLARQALAAISAWSRERKVIRVAALMNLAGMAMTSASNPNSGHHNPTLLLCGRVVTAIGVFLMVGIAFAVSFDNNAPTTKAS